jgi:hypothetical protein
MLTEPEKQTREGITVQELIDMLCQFPGDALVIRQDGEFNGSSSRVWIAEWDKLQAAVCIK